jgi:hypothetical protein
MPGMAAGAAGCGYAGQIALGRLLLVEVSSTEVSVVDEPDGGGAPALSDDRTGLPVPAPGFWMPDFSDRRARRPPSSFPAAEIVRQSLACIEWSPTGAPRRRRDP